MNKENKYGGLIEKLRTTHNISLDTLANILLVNTDTLNAVENGKAQLSDSQLNMCSNIFDVSKFALENGEIRPRIKHAELQFNLDRLMEQYRESLESQAFMLEAIQELTPAKRYKAQYSDLKGYDVYGYFVYDTQKEEIVKDENNQPVKYDTAKEALEAARRLDELYKEKQLDIEMESKAIEKENVTESVTKDKKSLVADEGQCIDNTTPEEAEDVSIKM